MNADDAGQEARRAVESLMEAMDRYADARAEYRKCVDSCEYDAGYFCQRYAEERDRARDEVVAAFAAAVRAALSPTQEERDG